MNKEVKMGAFKCKAWTKHKPTAWELRYCPKQRATPMQGIEYKLRKEKCARFYKAKVKIVGLQRQQE